MSEPQSAAETEKLREFEQRMHDEGAAAFGAGPNPWEQWEDAGTLGTWQRLEDTPRHPQRRMRRRSIGQRVLGAVTRLLVLMLLVGIGGVYLSTAMQKPVTLSDIRPAPIQTPHHTASIPDEDAGLADFDALPAPAAGTPWPVIEAVPAADSTPGDSAVADGAPAVTPPATATLGQPDMTALAMVAPDSGMTPEAVHDDADLAKDSGPVPSPALSDDPSDVLGYSEPAATVAETALPAVPPATASTVTVASAATPVTTTSAASNTQADAAAGPQPGTADLARQDTTPTVTPDVADTDAATVQPIETLSVEQAVDTAPPRSDSMTLAAPNVATGSEPATDEFSSLEAEPGSPPLPVRHGTGGDWVINLAAYNSEAIAQRMLEKFRARGVEAEVVSITVNDQPMVRIRSTGYHSASEAREWISLMEERLDLEGVWISKR